MIVQQKKMLEAFERVQTFLDAHPVAGPLSYADARSTLDSVVESFREFGAAQVSGRELSRGELRRQRLLVQQLFNRHLRPIVAIARTQGDAESGVRMSAVRMPRANAGVTKIMQACDGIIEAARPFEAAFVARGLPADFLTRFAAACAEIKRGVSDRAEAIGTHVGARAGLEVQARRGRAAIDRLDSVVRAMFDGDQVTLARWRTAKRVQRRRGAVTLDAVQESEAA